MTSFAPLGDCALLVELPGVDAVLAAYLELDREPLPGQLELVPGGESLLVTVDRPVDGDLRAELERRLAAAQWGARASAAPAGAEAALVLDICYDGADLGEVGALTGLGADGVVAAHTGTEWRVAFCGFAPGFSYLTGGDSHLTVPRRAEPRAEVPAGSVGLAGAYSGIYPRPSPGGWQLVGRVTTPLWDLDRRPPALLQPGMYVRFRAVRDAVLMTPPAPERDVPPDAGDDTSCNAGHKSGISDSPSRSSQTRAQAEPDSGAPQGGLRVVKQGMQTLVEDLGRSGYAAMGVSPSGAADRGAAIRANRLVGNPDGAAVLEILFGGAALKAEQAMTVAITGAPAPITVVADGGSTGQSTGSGESTTPTGSDQPIRLAAGQTLRLGRPRTGLRSYLAVAGGIDVPPVLGSRSADLLSGLGPPPVRTGDLLPIGRLSSAVGPRPAKAAGASPLSRADGAPAAPELAVSALDGSAAPKDETTVSTRPSSHMAGVTDGDPLEMRPGPQWAEFLAPEQLAVRQWTVGVDSNRIGVRLSGPALERRLAGEIPSQGLVRGAVQVPPSGQPIVFLADHPVTGGYPVIAVLTEAAVDRIAQCRPGQAVRFRLASGG